MSAELLIVMGLVVIIFFSATPIFLYLKKNKTTEDSLQIIPTEISSSKNQIKESIGELELMDEYGTKIIE